MLENTTVTLPLNDFDTLRVGERAHKDIARRLAACFDYKCTKKPTPDICEDCPNADIDCPDCEHYENQHGYEEKLTVDVERLIKVAKEYALYNKEVETELDEIPVERKAERVDA